MTIAPFDRRAVPAGFRFASWTARDGRALRRFEWRQPAAAARRGRMLFQTGYSEFAEKYLEAMAHWHARGWDISGFDWRGQGGSRDGRADAGLDMLAADLGDFAAEWHGSGAGPAVAVAHSMGGHLLLRQLANDPDGFDAAVLVAPMLGLNSRPFPPRIAAMIARSACRIGLGGRTIVQPGAQARTRQSMLTGDVARYADEAYWLAERPDYAMGPPRWRWLADAYASIATLDRPGMLERIPTPVLLIGTMRDRLVDPRAMAAAAARLPAATLVMRDDCAHELLRETDPVREAVLARIDRFLDGRWDEDAPA